MRKSLSHLDRHPNLPASGILNNAFRKQPKNMRVCGSGVDSRLSAKRLTVAMLVVAASLTSRVRAQGTSGNVVLNQGFNTAQDGQTHSFKILTLPPGQYAGSHVHLQATLNWSGFATNNAHLDVDFSDFSSQPGNPPQFTYSLAESGFSIQSFSDLGQMTGAIVGKALGALHSGNGTIEVLVTLQ